MADEPKKTKKKGSDVFSVFKILDIFKKKSREQDKRIFDASSPEEKKEILRARTRARTGAKIGNKE